MVGDHEHVDVVSPVFIGDAELAEQVGRLGEPAIAWSQEGSGSATT